MKRLLFVLLAIMTVVSCKSTQENETQAEVGTVSTAETTKPSTTVTAKDISFGEISWIAEQISPSFWPKELKNDSTMFVTFHMPVSEIVSVDSVTSIFVSSPKDMWTLQKSDIKHIVEMDTQEKKLVLKRLQCANGAIPLGEYNIEVSFNDGTVVSKSVTVSGLQNESTSQPSSSESTSGKNTKKQITYLVPKQSAKNHVECLAIPVINSVTKEADMIEIHFSVTDKRVKNGYFWFDVPGEKYYRDSGSMIDAQGNPVNGCRSFSTDGKDCVYILRKDSENSSWFSKITAAYFVVSDVNRVASPWEERIRSVSEKASVK